MNKHLITCILLVPLVCSCGKQATTSVDTREPLLLNDSLQEIITLDTVRDTPLTNELLLNGRVSFNPERVAHVQIKLAVAFAVGQVTVVFQFQQIVFGKQSILYSL